MKVVGIIRSIGERTEEFSKYLLEKQVDDVKVLKNVTPITKSVVEYLKLGLNFDFLVINDADVFIKPNCIKLMLKYINNNSMVTAHTISNFFGVRQGGIRIYNMRYGKDMINYLSKHEDIRPEASLHVKYGGKLIKDITSFHEYEQYYKDIYLRFIKHSIKSKKLINKFKKNMNNSLDFQVAYHGFFDKEKNFKKSFPNIKEKDVITDFNELEKKYKL